ncbi:MAG TPA: DNA repair protein RecN [Porticoccaceae bacterium]|nr:DNA repair protein RecN [Porticoccaceae bacterium]
MLTSLVINNFTLVSRLEQEFGAGMTVITGETGAGKSLILDALGLALGDRGDTDRIRLDAERVEVAASFDIGANRAAQSWLDEQGFERDTDSGECLVRRNLNREGRSRGYVNGQPATMAQLRDLGGLIIDIHNQHEHQSLLSREHQRDLLDDFGGYAKLRDTVAESYHDWSAARKARDHWRNNSGEISERRDLLSFQTQELEQLGLAEGEIETLEKEQLLLSNAESILRNCQLVLQLCDDSGDSEALPALSALNKACTMLEALPQVGGAIEEAGKLLDSARIQVAEAVTEIQQHLNSSELDPERLAQIEERLSLAYQLARKHKIKAEELPAHLRALGKELAQLETTGADGEDLEEQVRHSETQYLKAAEKLSKSRNKAAKAFATAVNGQLKDLAMGGASIEVGLNTNEGNRYSPNGLESVEFLVSTNPGQAHRALAKVASGGELSRISLAIQVVAAENSSIPVLVFDEVDVGVGGATASVIGKLLCKLGQSGQILCISHQAQVASYAQHHLLACKSQTDKVTESELVLLDETARAREIARMLGGEELTPATLSHAQEMLKASQSF